MISRKEVEREVCGGRKELPVIAIVSPQSDAYSETFIRAHIEGLPGNVRVLYGGFFPRYRGDGCRLLPPGTLPRRIARAIMRRILKLPRDAFEKAALKQFLREYKVDAVLAEYGPTGAAIMGACRDAGVPLIVHFHGADAYDRTILQQAGQKYPECFENAAAIIAVSRDMEQQLLHLGVPREKLHYNPYGVDTSFFQVGDLADVGPVFVAVGRFVDKKAPHLTLLAFRKAVEYVPKARLIMIGDGPLWEACKQLARALSIADQVDFLGSRPHLEVAATLRRARVFVQHSIRASYGDSEGTPVAVLEAGASGLPVVATRHGGIQDVVVEGETGFLVHEHDVEGMAAHMVLLIEQPTLAARLGRTARQHIETHFSMERSIGRLWSIIERCIAHGKNYRSQTEVGSENGIIRSCR